MIFWEADLKEVDEVSDQLRASGITDATGPSGKFWVIGFVNCCCFGGNCCFVNKQVQI